MTLFLFCVCLIEAVVYAVLWVRAERELNSSQGWYESYKNRYESELSGHTATKKLLTVAEEGWTMSIKNAEKYKDIAHQAIDLGMEVYTELGLADKQLKKAENLIDELTLDVVN